MSKTSTNLEHDVSYHKMLAANFTASGIGVTTLAETKQKETVLLVDESAWYVYLEETNEWYLQT